MSVSADSRLSMTRNPFLEQLRALQQGKAVFELEQEDEWEALPFRCPLPVHKVIDGFPRYDASATLLPPMQQAQIREIASLIISSFQPGCKPMMGVLLIGHADRDVQRGPAFEQEISVKRALGVRDALQRLVHAPGSSLRSVPGGLTPSSIDWRHKGVGAAQLIVPNPSTEEQRARNRRVEILLALRSYPSRRRQRLPAEPHPV